MEHRWLNQSSRTRIVTGPVQGVNCRSRRDHHCWQLTPKTWWSVSSRGGAHRNFRNERWHYPRWPANWYSICAFLSSKIHGKGTKTQGTKQRLQVTVSSRLQLTTRNETQTVNCSFYRIVAHSYHLQCRLCYALPLQGKDEIWWKFLGSVYMKTDI